MNDSAPFLFESVANCYTAGHSGVVAHFDWEDFDAPIPPFSSITWVVFLDDNRASTGALTYVPGSHWRHFEDETGAPGERRIREQMKAAEYTPIELTAGSLLVRVTEVWHAVTPVTCLRRYITGSYIRRSRVSVEMQRKRDAEIQKRRQRNIKVPAALENYYY
jgi:hypothetical protein